MKLKHYYRLWKERDRIFAWKKRHHPNGKRYSWAEAFEATMNKPPTTFYCQESSCSRRGLKIPIAKMHEIKRFPKTMNAILPITLKICENCFNKMKKQ